MEGDSQAQRLSNFVLLFKNRLDADEALNKQTDFNPPKSYRPQDPVSNPPSIKSLFTGDPMPEMQPIRKRLGAYFPAEIGEYKPVLPIVPALPPLCGLSGSRPIPIVFTVAGVTNMTDGAYTVYPDPTNPSCNWSNSTSSPTDPIFNASYTVALGFFNVTIGNNSGTIQFNSATASGFQFGDTIPNLAFGPGTPGTVVLSL